MHRSSCSRKGSSCFARHRVSWRKPRPGFRCSSRNRTAVSCSGRWISREVPDPFASDRAAIESHLDGICSSYLTAVDGALGDAVRYGLKSPGKRIRPLLLAFAYRAAGGSGDPTLLACAPEVIHAYSLIHDDLPCMDDDDMRRGQPTVHKVYGSATAIVAGVVMIPLALRVARDASLEMRLARPTVTRI